MDQSYSLNISPAYDIRSPSCFQVNIKYLTQTHIYDNVFLYIVKGCNMSRLTIDITDQQHQALKAIAALQGKTIKEYAVERLFPEAGNDEEAMVDLRKLLEMRVAEVSCGEVSTKSITEIASEVMQTGGMA